MALRFFVAGWAGLARLEEIPHPRPGDELNTELGWVTHQDYSIEIRQQSVVPRQAVGRQLGRCLHLAHIRW